MVKCWRIPLRLRGNNVMKWRSAALASASGPSFFRPPGLPGANPTNEVQDAWPLHLTIKTTDI